MALHMYAVVKVLLNFTEKYGNYSYHHYDWTRECNFAVLKTTVTEYGWDEKLDYTVELVSESSTEIRHKHDHNWDHGFQTSCCNIL